MITKNNIHLLFDFIKKQKKTKNLKIIQKNNNFEISKSSYTDDIIINKDVIFNCEIDKSLKEIALIVIPLLMKYKKFFIAQLGQSLDGKIALFNGNSHYINSQKSIMYLHALRCICDGLLVGVNTVINDNPLLTTRYMTGSSPMRIIIDPSLKLTNRLNIFKDGNKNIVFTQKASKKTLNNTTIYKLPKKNFTKSVYQKIIDLNFNYILVEGGATTISNFLEQELLDIMQFIIAPIIIGSGIDSIKLKSISTLKNALRPKSHLYKLGDEIIASLEF
jgi:riboflavin-specific deaminase-like protein